MNQPVVEFEAELKGVNLKAKNVDGTPFPLIEIKLEQFNPKHMELLKELGEFQLKDVIVTVTPKTHQMNLFEGSEEVEDEPSSENDVDFD